VKRTFLSVVGVLLSISLTAPGVLAQTGTDGGDTDEAAAEKTIEELYLESDLSIRSIESMVISYDRDAQRMGIRALADRAENGQVDPNSEEYVAVASTALRSGVGNISNNPSLLPDSYHPLVRIEAAYALGRSAHPRAQTYLITTLRTDPEPSVKAATMIGLAEQGVDPEGRISYEIAAAIQKELTVRADEGMLYQGLQAIEDLTATAGTDDLNPIVRETVIEIVTSGLSRRVREKAIMVLNKL
jgi:hypothetical protein